MRHSLPCKCEALVSLRTEDVFVTRRPISILGIDRQIRSIARNHFDEVSVAGFLNPSPARVGNGVFRPEELSNRKSYAIK